MPDEASKQAYLAAYGAWQQQLAALHEVLIDGARLPPQQLKGLLNREARAKHAYDRARLALLGIESESEEFEDGE